MIEANEVNSTFYALRLLSHRLDTSQIKVTEGEGYPTSEFTKAEQEQALEIIHSIEDSESISFDQLPPEKIHFYLTGLADRIEELANSDLANAGYAVEPTALGPEDQISGSESPLSHDLHDKIDGLHGEFAYIAQLAQAAQTFFERVNSSDPDKTYRKILTHARGLLEAEGGSLWVFDEGSNEIILRAAAGFADAKARVCRMRLGEGISGRVLQSGQPLIVENLATSELTAATAEGNYKTKSFISYPLTIGGRKLGVLNVTDKAGGGTFDEVDLAVLDLIGSQIALALEGAERQERAIVPNDPDYHNASRS